MELIITEFGGNCPVQASGTVNGVPFYFRARGDRWRMAIGIDPVDIACGYKDGWHRGEKWGSGPYDAGWMDNESAKRIIKNCAEVYTSEMEGKG